MQFTNDQLNKLTSWLKDNNREDDAALVTMAIDMQARLYTWPVKVQAIIAGLWKEYKEGVKKPAV